MRVPDFGFRVRDFGIRVHGFGLLGGGVPALRTGGNWDNPPGCSPPSRPAGSLRMGPSRYPAFEYALSGFGFLGFGTCVSFEYAVSGFEILVKARKYFVGF